MNLPQNSTLKALEKEPKRGLRKINRKNFSLKLNTTRKARNIRQTDFLFKVSRPRRSNSNYSNRSKQQLKSNQHNNNPRSRLISITHRNNCKSIILKISLEMTNNKKVRHQHLLLQKFKWLLERVFQRSPLKKWELPPRDNNPPFRNIEELRAKGNYWVEK